MKGDNGDKRQTKVISATLPNRLVKCSPVLMYIVKNLYKYCFFFQAKSEGMRAPVVSTYRERRPLIQPKMFRK